MKERGLVCLFKLSLSPFNESPIKPSKFRKFIKEKKLKNILLKYDSYHKTCRTVKILLQMNKKKRMFKKYQKSVQFFFKS